MTPGAKVTSAPLMGAPYRTYTLEYRGQVLRSQLSPFGDDEIAALVRSHLAPVATPPVREIRAKPGRKPMSIREQPE
jgi:hypothetical protein